MANNQPPETEFVDIKLIECNRQFSTESLDQTNEENAVFTCKTGEIKVNIGDKISVADAFISEVGGGADVIQFEGIKCKEKVSLTKTIITPIGDDVLYSPFGKEGIDVSETNDDYESSDNETNIQINYYKVANGENHIMLPNSFVYSGGMLTDPTTDYSLWYSNKSDSVGCWTWGTTPADYSMTTYPTIWSICGDDVGCTSYQDKQGVNHRKIYPKIKNDRYMIFIRKGEAYFTNTNTKLLSDSHYNEPSFNRYVRYNDVVNLKLSKGFSAPVNIATDLTNQLTEIKTREEIKGIINPSAFGNNGNGRIAGFSTKMNSECCKPFYCATTTNFNDTDRQIWVDDDDEDPAKTTAEKGSAWKYDNNYLHVGFKRPQLREALENGYRKDFWGTGIGWDADGLFVEKDDPTNTGIMGLHIFYTDGDLDRNGNLNTYFTWNKDNLILIKQFFDAQRMYPELWDYKYNEVINTFIDSTDAPQSTARDWLLKYIDGKPDDTRFLHINQSGTWRQGYDNQQLGSDNYENKVFSDCVPSVADRNNCSAPFWVDYTKETEDIFIDEVESDKLSYGFAIKHLAPNGKYYIAFSINGKANGTNPKLVNPQYTIQSPIVIDKTGFGIDPHFTAYGTSALMLFNGLLHNDRATLNVQPPAQPTTEQEKSTQLNWYVDKNVYDLGKIPFAVDMMKYLCWVNLGANQPLINFDEKESRFSISQLHYPEYIGNTYNAGDGTDEHPVAPEPMNMVYKLNKRMNQFTFTPDLMPMTTEWVSYNQAKIIGDTTAEQKTFTKQFFDMINPFMEQYVPFDAHSGISVKNWGYNLETTQTKNNEWKKGLWFILGFNQKDLVSTNPQDTDNSLNIRYTNNQSINNNPNPTTNAVINIQDNPQMVMNLWGSNIMSPCLPVGSRPALSREPFMDSGNETMTHLFEPSVNIVQTSSEIIATNYPRKMRNAFYTIRSNIIDQLNYIGGATSGNPLNIVSVVSKQNPEGDFYFGGQSQLEYTCTKPFTISEITTSIHKPDQTLADVDDGSVVIYKIQKKLMATTDLISQVMNNNKKK